MISMLVGLMLGSSVAWSAPDCAQLQIQLQEMQKAQGILLESMVKKNDSLANTLDHFAEDLKSHEQKPSRADVVNLHNSAEAFRGHSERELALIEKFQQKSLELIAQTVRCLPSSTATAQNLHQ